MKMKGRLLACLTLIVVPLILRGQDWEELRTGPFEAVTVMTDGTIVALSNGFGYRSTDDGESWITGNVAPIDVTIMREGPGGQLFAATFFGRDGLNRSTDRGNSWQFWANIRAWDVAFNSQGHILVATEGNAVLRSTDQGANWTVLQDEGMLPLIWSITVDRQDVIYAGTQGEGIFRSTDNGETWTDLFGEQRAIVEGIAVAPDGTIYFAGATGMGVLQGPLPMVGFFRSTDAGVTWEDISHDDSTQVGKRIVVTSSGTLYIATIAARPPFQVDVLRSTDRGDTWESLVGDVQFGGIHALVMDSRERLYVAAEAGLYRMETSSSTPTSGAPIANEALTLITDANGIDSYIRVRLKEHQNGSVEMVDVQGRIVGSIPLDPSGLGEQRLSISALNLEPGLYLCRLSNEVESEGIKVIVR